MAESWPVLRGGATLIQSMALGVKALNFSAKIYEDDLRAKEELVRRAVSVKPKRRSSDGTLDENFRRPRSR